MGRRNFLVEGVSGTGKTTVAEELERRGHQVVHGDRALAYQGDPVTGEPLAGHAHGHHVWRVETVRALAADPTAPATFFCGGSRNHARVRDVFDAVFVLEVDLPTLERRLRGRADDEFGGRPEELELVRRVHRTGEDTPDGVPVDATRPVALVVDEILLLSGVTGSAGAADLGEHPGPATGEDAAMTRTAVHAAGAPAPVGPYSHAVVARGELVHLSGQTPIDPATGRLVEGGVAEQVQRVLANLDQVLGAAGLTFADVVKVNVYLTDMADFAAMNEVYGTVFAAPHPARTTVAVAGLPLGARVEIELVAVRAPADPAAPPVPGPAG